MKAILAGVCASAKEESWVVLNVIIQCVSIRISGAVKCNQRDQGTQHKTCPLERDSSKIQPECLWEVSWRYFPRSVSIERKIITSTQLNSRDMDSKSTGVLLNIMPYILPKDTGATKCDHLS